MARSATRNFPARARRTYRARPRVSGSAPPLTKRSRSYNARGGPAIRVGARAPAVDEPNDGFVSNRPRGGFLQKGSACRRQTTTRCASAATFSRFIPEIKERYHYGAIIFILTFAMVTVSSYRVESAIQFAHERLTTVAVGVAICLFTTVFVFPIWAGEELHELAAGNLDKLA